MNLLLFDDIDSYMIKYHCIKQDFILVKNVIDYIYTNKGLNHLPDSIRNRDDAFIFLIAHNHRAIDLNRFRLKLKEDTSVRFPSVWKYMILDVEEVNANSSYLEKKRYIKLYGIDQPIDLHEYL